MKLKLSLPTRVNYTVMFSAIIFLLVCTFTNKINTIGDVLHYAALSALFTSVGAILLPAAWFLQRQKERFAMLHYGIKRVPASLILLAIAIGAALYMLSSGLSSVFEQLAANAGFGPGQSVEYDVDSWRIVGTIAVTALIPAVAEETLFHGVLLFGWLDNSSGGNQKRRIIGALLFSTLIFTLFHCDLVNFVPIAITCFTLGVMSYMSKSVLPSMVTHFTVGVLGIILYAVSNETSVSEYASLGFANDMSGTIFYCVVGAALTAALLLVYRTGVRKNAERDKQARTLLRKAFSEMKDDEMIPAVKHFCESLNNMEKLEQKAQAAQNSAEQDNPNPYSDPVDVFIAALPVMLTLAILLSLNMMTFVARLPQ